MVTNNLNDSEAFRALADPTRRGILELLGKGSLSVGEIAVEFPMSRPAISKHLRILEQARLVSEVREGRRHVYQVDSRPLATVRRWLELFEEAETRPVAKRRTRRVKPATPRAEREPAVVVEDDWKQW